MILLGNLPHYHMLSSIGKGIDDTLKILYDSQGRQLDYRGILNIKISCSQDAIPTAIIEVRLDFVSEEELKKIQEGTK